MSVIPFRVGQRVRHCSGSLWEIIEPGPHPERSDPYAYAKMCDFHYYEWLPWRILEPTWEPTPSPKSPFRDGQMVRHEKYGECRVMLPKHSIYSRMAQIRRTDGVYVWVDWDALTLIDEDAPVLKIKDHYVGGKPLAPFWCGQRVSHPVWGDCVIVFAGPGITGEEVAGIRVTGEHSFERTFKDAPWSSLTAIDTPEIQVGDLVRVDVSQGYGGVGKVVEVRGHSNRVHFDRTIPRHIDRREEWFWHGHLTVVGHEDPSPPLGIHVTVRGEEKSKKVLDAIQKTACAESITIAKPDDAR